ncbi:Reduced folate carrier,Major facilitator superfamily domain [Cinara cedri]|uniref:Reduced folate carrier,Major facilitator superfamily domain n=1 Tax=Cinara cedri TaxID=506608 RepID=A0A5E4NH41_9HEMI|nr:Reduced folate carrier,Major facilitator superfamily domain [Cinara cedri]
MEYWKKVTFLLSLYMFLFEIRPLETYLTSYLTGPNGNVSLSEVANTMTSIRSYTALMAAVIMFCISEYFFKSAIIVFTIFSFITYVLLTGTPSLTQLRVSMVGIGATSHTFVLGYSYLFSQIDDTKLYQSATSIISFSLLFGIFVGSILAQIITSTSQGVYSALPYCNAFAMFLALICACLFPVKMHHYYLTDNFLNENSKLLRNGLKTIKEFDGETIIIDRFKKKNTVEIVLDKLFLDFKTSFANTTVIKRSLWYMVSMGTHFQIINNMNVLYSYIISRPGNNDVLMNGDADALINLCGALGAYLIGRMKLDWTYHGDTFIAFCTTITGVLMASCYFYNHLISIYLTYVMYSLVCQMAFTINLSEIAKHLKNNCFSIVLGFNLIGALLVSSSLMLFFVQINFLDITIPGRFLFIGGMNISLGVVFWFLSYSSIHQRNTL